VQLPFILPWLTFSVLQNSKLLSFADFSRLCLYATEQVAAVVGFECFFPGMYILGVSSFPCRNACHLQHHDKMMSFEAGLIPCACLASNLYQLN
jgi:hypothetical protein